MTTIRIPKAAEFVAKSLRNEIIRGERKEGDFLPQESLLCEQFGVSRPTLREAIRVLESEGLLSVARGARGGARIHRPDSIVAARHFGRILQANGTTVADVFQARIIIEPPAARIVAETKSRIAPPILRGWIEQSKSLVDNNAEFGTASNAFYRTLVELSGIETLSLLCQMLDGVLSKYNALVWTSSTQQRDQASSKRGAIKAKERLVTLIEQGDGAAAEIYLREHVTAVATLMAKWELSGKVVDLLEDV